MFCSVGFFHAAGFLINDNEKAVQQLSNYKVADFIPIKINELKSGFVTFCPVNSFPDK
jgi:hypothetical protein